MSSISNAVFEFISGKVANADSNSAIYNAEIHASFYESMKNGSAKYIRVGDVQSSKPQPAQRTDGTRFIKEFNAYLTVQFLARTTGKTLENLKEARSLATAMALEAVDYIDADQELGTTDDSICGCLVDRKEDDWKDISTVEHAVSYLLLKINPGGET